MPMKIRGQGMLSWVARRTGWGHGGVGDLNAFRRARVEPRRSAAASNAVPY